MRNLVVVNGPNLNLLGTREPDVYGTTTLSELDARVVAWGTELGLVVDTFQSNHEGELIDRLHRAGEDADGVVLNAGALTHYSYALHDAIAAIGVPTVEVHISNVKARQPWRAHSVIEPACAYSIYGRGIPGYRDAMRHLVWSAASPPQALRYGDDPDQVADLRLPSTEGPHPVAVVIHGGFWRDVWTRDIMGGIAADLTDRGWATWNIEYRRVGGRGGFPETLEDVSSAIDHLDTVAADHPLDLSRVVTIGHSAGGHLALWAAGRPKLGVGTSGSGPRVEVIAAVGIAAVSDLAVAHEMGLGGGAVADLLGRSPTEGSGRYQAASPAALLPLGVRQVLIHGADDRAVPIELSEAYAGAAAEAGDPVVFHALEGVGHFEVLDAESSPWRVVAAELEELR